MSALLAALSDLPSWAVSALIDLLVVIVKLVRAPDDAAREAALMDAAEAMKRALDAKKFGPSQP